jgi:hypothetical protein
VGPILGPTTEEKKKAYCPKKKEKKKKKAYLRLINIEKKFKIIIFLSFNAHSVKGY